MRSTACKALASAALMLGCAESAVSVKPTVVELPSTPAGTTSATVENEEPPSKPNASASQPAHSFTCSMHPQIHEATAGACPICGMDLIEVQ